MNYWGEREGAPHGDDGWRKCLSTSDVIILVSRILFHKEGERGLVTRCLANSTKTLKVAVECMNLNMPCPTVYCSQTCRQFFNIALFDFCGTNCSMASPLTLTVSRMGSDS